MSGHTDGPWIAAPYSSVVGAPVVAASGRSIAKVTYYAFAADGFANHERESEANGWLIAAAPDLLAACKAVDALGMLNPTGSGAVEDAARAVKAAIAKAEGRP